MSRSNSALSVIGLTILSVLVWRGVDYLIDRGLFDRCEDEEICNGMDDNCNSAIDEGVQNTYYEDGDGDGFGVKGRNTKACSRPEGYSTRSGDCADTKPDVKPGVKERCNGIDDNCDGAVDEGAVLTYYLDKDGDGHGTETKTYVGCSTPEGYVPKGDDCNDNNPAVNPGAQEVCDYKDNNCRDGADEGVIPTWYADHDEDGFGNEAIPIYTCVQPMGYVTNLNDCNDRDESVYKGAKELCNGIDDNCDGTVDEGHIKMWYIDRDHDGYGTKGVVSCLQPEDGVLQAKDCNDKDPTIHPGAEEVCDGKDNNCDGQLSGPCDILRQTAPRPLRGLFPGIR